MARPDATDDAIHTNTARRDKLIVLGRDIDLLRVAGKDSRRAGRSPRYWAIYEFSRLANRDGEIGRARRWCRDVAVGWRFGL